MNRLSQFIYSILLTTMALGIEAVELPDFTGLAKQFGPAVVNISTSQNHSTKGRRHGFSVPDLPEDSPLREFFRHFLDDNAPDDDIQARSLGSGFFISADGYILTNHHVVDGADEIIVRTTDRREFKAEVVGSDRRSDTALLKVDVDDASSVQIGSAKDLEVGEWVLAIGSPFGFDHSVTAGIVSAKGRSLPSENYVPFIQTDVAINPGNSGGPLIDLDGNVVGVNSQIYSRTGGFMGLSFAVPIDLAMNVVDQLRTKGRVSRGWLGVMIQDVTRELAETFAMRHPRGALVAQVMPSSPAEKAGVQLGDVIVAFNGQRVNASSSLPPLVGASPIDRPSDLKILREGKEMTLQVVIGELPEEGKTGGIGPLSRIQPTNALGLNVRDLSAEESEQLGLKHGSGVLVEEVVAGPAAGAGMRQGDVILMLNNQHVGSVDQFRGIVSDLPQGKSVAVLVQREGGRLFMAMRTPR